MVSKSKAKGSYHERWFLKLFNKLGIKTKRFLWSGAVCAGLLLWTSGAVKHTLTAGLAHVEDGRIEFYQIPGAHDTAD